MELRKFMNFHGGKNEFERYFCAINKTLKLCLAKRIWHDVDCAAFFPLFPTNVVGIIINELPEHFGND
jgi:hypothetical protein